MPVCLSNKSTRRRQTPSHRLGVRNQALLLLGGGAPVVLVAGDDVHDDAVRIADCTLPHRAQSRLSVHVLTAPHATCPGAVAHASNLLAQLVNLS